MSENISVNNIYQTQIPSLTDAANIKDAFKLYHFGSTTEPASASVSAGIAKHLYDLQTLKAAIAGPTFTGTLTAPTINASTALQIGGVAITSSAAELNLIDNSVAGTIVNSKAVIYGAAGQVNATTLQIAGTSVLAAGTPLTGTYGGTGVNNGAKTITLGGNLTTSGAFATTLTATGTTTVTLPTSGTLAISSGSQTFTGVQTFTSPSITTSLTTVSTSFDLVNTTATTVNFAGAATTLIIGGVVNATTTIAAGGANLGTNTVNIATGNVSTGSYAINIGTGNISTGAITTTIGNTVKLPQVANSTAGFVKTSTDGTLSRSASVAYSELPTNVGVVARKVSLVGTGSGFTIALTHGLGTNLLTAQVYDTSTSTATLVTTGITITVTSTVATATFSTSQTLTNYTLVVIG